MTAVVFGSILFLLTSPIEVSAHHGQEVSIAKSSVDVIRKDSSGLNATSIRLLFNYVVKDPSVKNSPINSVMKIFDPSGVLLKTSSSKQGFFLNDTGSHYHLTTLANNTKSNLKVVAQFTDLGKTSPLSNPIEFPVNLTNARNEISAFPG